MNKNNCNCGSTNLRSIHEKQDSRTHWYSLADCLDCGSTVVTNKTKKISTSRTILSVLILTVLMFMFVGCAPSGPDYVICKLYLKDGVTPSFWDVTRQRDANGECNEVQSVQ